MGFGDNQFAAPNAVAVDAWGNVYVVDTFNNRIQKFTSDGAFVGKWGFFGARGGQFVTPVGIAVSPTEHVYVADQLDCSIQRYAPLRAILYLPLILR